MQIFLEKIYLLFYHQQLPYNITCMDKNETQKMMKELAHSKSPENACARNKEIENQIIKLHKEHGRGVLNVLRAKTMQHLLKYLDDLFPMLRDPKYSLGMKIYWLENNIMDFPICCNRDHGDHTNETDKCTLKGYETIFCCSHCEATSSYQQDKREATKELNYGDPHYTNREKAAKTLLKKTGYANPFSNPRIIKKMVAKKKAKGNYCNRTKRNQTLLERIRLEWRGLSWGTRKYLEFLEKEGVVKHLEPRDYTTEEKTKLSWKIRTYKIMVNKWKKFKPLFTLDEWIDADKFKDDLPWECKKCGHQFKSFFNGHYREYHRCLKCEPLENGRSAIEIEMQDFIEDIHPHPSYDRNTKHIISPVELDDYIRDLNLAFEMDGIYTHLSTFKKPGYHTYKTKRCDELGIHLIHIFEDEWKLQQNLCKSNIAKSLGDKSKHVEVVQANDCELVELSEVEATKFFEDNSIRWKSEVLWDWLDAKERLFKIYGLKRKCDSKLVFACIILKNKRLSFDLMHFSEAAFISVSGALEMVVKEISKHAKSITCDLDKRWYLPQEKKTLAKLGFKMVKMIRARFFWVNYGYDQRYNPRQLTKKFILENQKRMFGLGYKYDNSKSIEENLLAGKCAKIFNAGQQHYVMHI